MNTKKQNVSGISKFLFTTLLAAAMTTSAWADIVINNGEKVYMGAGAKTDYTENITINAGGTWESNGSRNANVHFHHTNDFLGLLSPKVLKLNGNGNNKAKIDFQNESNGTRASIAVLYTGKLQADYAAIYVGDLGFSGKATINNSVVDVAGIVAFGKNALYSQSVENTTMTVKGHSLLNEPTYYSSEGTILHNLTMTNSSITVDDGVAGTVAENVTLKTLTMKSGSDLTVETGTGVFVSGSVKVENSSLNVGMLMISGGSLTFSGTGVLRAESISGGNVVVSSGATLTLSASSLLSNVTNNGGTVLFEKVDSEVSLSKDSAPLTVGTSETGTVQLKTESENVVVNKAEQIATQDVVVDAEGVVVEKVLAAWSFDVENNGEGVTVTMDVGGDVDVSTIKIFHRENADSAWEDYTDKVADISLADGKLTFTATSFSDYTAVSAVAVPEPSAFGLLAGLGAIALAVSRRRRK